MYTLERARYSHTFGEYGADYGMYASKKETYFYYKVHAMITLEGFITNFEITPASTDDKEGLQDMTDGLSNIIILGDKGYIGENFYQERNEERTGNLSYVSKAFQLQR